MLRITAFLISTKLFYALLFALSLLLPGCSENDKPAQDQGLLDSHATQADLTVMDSAKISASQDQSAGDSSSEPPIVLLSNENPCKIGKIGIIPDEGEAGHYYAVRLTPKTYPFTAFRIRYSLWHNPTNLCDSTLAHKVLVFVGTQTKPEATPTIKDTLNIPKAPLPSAERLVEQDLTTPLTLQQGEHLFIAVEMAGDTQKGTVCVISCEGKGLQDTNYWSGASAPPYTWTSMVDQGNGSMEALGYEQHPD